LSQAASGMILQIKGGFLYAFSVSNRRFGAFEAIIGMIFQRLISSFKKA
jgi:hypothetical protein